MNLDVKKYPYARQSIDEHDIQAVVDALQSPLLTQGPTATAFEKMLCDYTGARYAVALANGTAALHLAVLALDLQPHHVGITSPITFLATANCLLYAGAQVAFADIEPETANIDPAEIEKKINQNTKVLLPVHFAGQSCDMEKIHEIAQRHKLYVIEDAAHAIGSEYKGSKVGNCAYSDMTIFSFHPVKTIATGEGGAITTNSEELYKKLLMLRICGVTRDQSVMTQNDGPWYYQMHYLGFNYRMTEMQAALGISQFKRLPAFIQRRREIVAMYKEAFARDERFSFLVEKPFSQAAFHLCPILLNFDVLTLSKKEIYQRLSLAGLMLQVHYIPVHTQPYYQKIGFKNGDCPRAEKYYLQTLSLPLYYELTDDDVKNIIAVVKREVI